MYWVLSQSIVGNPWAFFRTSRWAVAANSHLIIDQRYQKNIYIILYIDYDISIPIALHKVWVQ